MPTAILSALSGIWRFLGLPGIILAGALAWQYVHYEGLPIIGGGKIDQVETERDTWKLASQKWRSAHAKLNGKYQMDLARAERDRAQAQADYDDAARRADRAEADLNDMRDRATRYANRMRITVRQGEPGAPGTDHPAEDRDGPGEATEFIAVARNDFDILVENSLRLEKVFRWGQDLIDRKRAVALPEPDLGGN